MGATAQAQLSTDDGDRTWRQDRDHFVHPWTHFDSFKTEGSLVIAEGKGAYVYDSAGKPYLDGIGGLWCVNIGYGNEEMVQAIADQARRLAFFSAFVDTTNPPAAELAAKLAALAPGRLNHVCYTCTGSDATTRPSGSSISITRDAASRRRSMSSRASTGITAAPISACP